MAPTATGAPCGALNGEHTTSITVTRRRLHRGVAVPGLAWCAAVCVLLLAGAVPALANCPHGCSAQGTCDYTTDTCTCYPGFHGPDCSLRGCPFGNAWFDYATAVDTLHASAECSNQGVCDRSTGHCKCHPGFGGTACDVIGCHNACSGHGQCHDLEMAARLQDDIRLLTTTSYSLWDKNNICGCVCDEGYTGYDCSLRECPFGDDPLTTWQVDEVQKLTCECDATCSGGVKFSFRGQSTGTIAYNAVAMISDENSAVTTAGSGRGESVQAKLQALRTIHGVTVTISGSGTICQTSATTTHITFTHDPGDVPALAITNNLATTGSTASMSITADGTSTSVIGTKERLECSGRGTCSRTTGECSCFDSFGPSDRTGGSGDVLDCGYNTTLITACPGECSEHGTCSADSAWQCTCWEGYTGHDCNERLCPFGKAWWDEPSATDTAHGFAECSNKGICNVKTGECKCQEGWEGAACDRVACPKDGDGNACSGRGKCRTLTQAQPIKTINGEYVGNLEVQSLACTASSGTVALSFDGATTADIAYNAAASAVKSALEALPTIGLVTVTYSTGAAACSAGGVTITITFLTEFGDRDAITSTSTGMAATATEVTKGSRMTYGTNLLATTWDWDMIQGCVCDHDRSYNYSSSLSSASTGDILGSQAYDCSERRCPHGDDPKSSATKAHEVQNVTCGATSGTFTLTFRQTSSTAIAYDANAATVTAALEAMHTIGDVTVTMTHGVACGSLSPSWTVTFLTELGDLPLMTAEASSGATITVAQTTAGTMSNVECSDRGICDRKYGVCKCFDGYVSGDSSTSDNGGWRGDCGHSDAMWQQT